MVSAVPVTVESYSRFEPVGARLSGLFFFFFFPAWAG